MCVSLFDPLDMKPFASSLAKVDRQMACIYAYQERVSLCSIEIANVVLHVSVAMN